MRHIIASAVAICAMAAIVWFVGQSPDASGQQPAPQQPKAQPAPSQQPTQVQPTQQPAPQQPKAQPVPAQQPTQAQPTQQPTPQQPAQTQQQPKAPPAQGQQPQAQQPQGQQPRQQPTPGHLNGRVADRPSGQLVKFGSPVMSVPHVQPAPRDGFRWHWHPSYGWVSLPLVGAPVEILLPQNYVLPAQVGIYEAAQVQPGQIVCPHCGQPIILQAR